MRPKIHPVTATVQDARELFEDDHVHMILLVDGDRLVGTLTRDDLPINLDGRRAAAGFAKLRDRTIGPAAGAEETRLAMIAARQRRLAVVDSDLVLLGLLCLKRRLHGFCVDPDVASREAERRLRRLACVLP
ncbi:CBS domain-containing protein [Nocardioides sp. CN2-186]|uniref:CBS domain-containing protein n=1 Tax=Nocardioides tweenelious TaxID=3156607 RepID=UPI0032B3BB05